MSDEPNNMEDQKSEDQETKEGTEAKADDQEEKNEPEKKYTDADVDSIINKKFAKWKADADKAIADAKAEGEKLAKMNEEQKRQYEDEKRQKEIDDLKAENEGLKQQAVRVELSKKASELLKDQDIDATQDMLDFVVGDDAEATQTNIDKFVGIIKSQLKAAEVKRATGTTPKSYNNGDKELSVFDKHLAKYK